MSVSEASSLSFEKKELYCGVNTVIPPHYVFVGRGFNFSFLTLTPRSGTKEIFAKLDHLLWVTSAKKEEVGYFFAVRGPGSFTGIRLGLAIAKAFELFGRAKVFTTTSLKLLAAELLKEGETGEVWFRSTKNLYYSQKLQHVGKNRIESLGGIETHKTLPNGVSAHERLKTPNPLTMLVNAEEEWEPIYLASPVD